MEVQETWPLTVFSETFFLLNLRALLLTYALLVAFFPLVFFCAGLLCVLRFTTVTRRFCPGSQASGKQARVDEVAQKLYLWGQRP